MNKLFQIALITGLLTTVNFAAELNFRNGVEIGAEVKLSLKNGQIVTIGNGKIIDNYGTISGPELGTATFKCEDGAACLINHTHNIEEVTNLPTAYVGLGDNYYHIEPCESGGTIVNIENIAFDHVEYANGCNILPFVQQKEQNENIYTPVVILGGNNGETTEVSLVNASETPHSTRAKFVNMKSDGDKVGYNVAHSLRVKGPFDLLGDQSKFTEETVTFDGSMSTVGGPMFQSKMHLTNNADITVSGDTVDLSKDILIDSGSKLTFSAKVTLSSNMTIFLGADLLQYVIDVRDYENNNSSQQSVWGPHPTNNMYYALAFYTIDGENYPVSIYRSDSLANGRPIIDQNYSHILLTKLYNILKHTINYSAFEPVKSEETNLAQEDSLRDMVNIQIGNLECQALGHLTAFTYKEIYDLFSAIEKGKIPYVGSLKNNEDNSDEG